MELSRRLAAARGALRRRLLRHRRPLAALLLAAAAASGVRALAPPAPPSTALLVAARDLPAGQVPGPGDLVTARLPPGAVPAGALTPDSPLRGRPLATPLRAGEPLTDVRLAGPGLAAGQPPGTVAAPLRLADGAQAALLRPGDVVDLLGTGAPDTAVGGTELLAAGVRVLAVPPPAPDDGGALPGRLVVVALRSSDVYHVTAGAVAGYVTYTWSRS